MKRELLLFEDEDCKLSTNKIGDLIVELKSKEDLKIYEDGKFKCDFMEFLKHKLKEFLIRLDGEEKEITDFIIHRAESGLQDDKNKRYVFEEVYGVVLGYTRMGSKMFAFYDLTRLFKNLFTRENRE